MADEARFERLLKLFWALCPGLEATTLRKLIRVFKSATALHNADEEKWKAAVRLHTNTVERMNRWREGMRELDSIVDHLGHKEVSYVVAGDDEYPESLYDLYDPPVVLFVRGDKKLLKVPQVVSVVGTRRATSYGLEVTRWISSTLVRHGIAVCSGLAIGIDTASHVTAVQNQGKTIAVLGSGIDICYPPSNRNLYAHIRKSGLLVSEYGPGTPVAKFRFPERNRIISALGRVVVVVQAGDKSGAILTAENAMEIGRDVYVVPGPITSKSFRGAHRLLVDGAIPLIDPDDIVELMGGELQTKDQVNHLVPEHLRCLFTILVDEGALRAGELASVSGLPPSHVYAALLEMEINRFARRLPDGRYQAVSEPSSIL